jgi:hypothetical protein
MADHNGSTDVSTTPLLGVLDTNHHVSHVCMRAMDAPMDAWRLKMEQWESVDVVPVSNHSDGNGSRVRSKVKNRIRVHILVKSRIRISI